MPRGSSTQPRPKARQHEHYRSIPESQPATSEPVDASVPSSEPEDEFDQRPAIDQQPEADQRPETDQQPEHETDPSEYTVDELREALEDITDRDQLEALLTREEEGKDRRTAKEAIHRRMRALENSES